jgi:hypothetical protein
VARESIVVGGNQPLDFGILTLMGCLSCWFADKDVYPSAWVLHVGVGVAKEHLDHGEAGSSQMAFDLRYRE